MAFEKNKEVKGFPFTLVRRDSGAAITTGVMSGFTTLDGGIQTPLSGAFTHEGNGQWSIDVITAAEFNGEIVGLIFTHADAVPASFTINTVTKTVGQAVVKGDGTSLVGTASFYGSIAEADNYFTNERLNSGVWDEAQVADKNSALVSATRLIDRLSIRGVKTVSTQVLQFPRDADTIIPQDIRLATYEIAITLLDDFDQEQEIRSLETTTQTFAGVRSTYDRSWLPDHIKAGIPSYAAWLNIMPYLRDIAEISLSRVN